LILIDHKERQLQEVRKDRRAFIEATSLEQFNTNTKRKQYPAGSVFFWSLGAVYGPIGSANRKVSAE
jgi:hypothetical protein